MALSGEQLVKVVLIKNDVFMRRLLRKSKETWCNRDGTNEFLCGFEGTWVSACAEICSEVE